MARGKRRPKSSAAKVGRSYAFKAADDAGIRWSSYRTIVLPGQVAARVQLIRNRAHRGVLPT